MEEPQRQKRRQARRSLELFRSWLVISIDCARTGSTHRRDSEMGAYKASVADAGPQFTDHKFRLCADIIIWWPPE